MEDGKETRRHSKPKAIRSNAMQEEHGERLSGQISDKVREKGICYSFLGI